MLKGWFFYNRSERRAVIFLLFVLIGIVYYITCHTDSDRHEIDIKSLAIADSLYTEVKREEREWKRGTYKEYAKSKPDMLYAETVARKPREKALLPGMDTNRKDTFKYPKQEKFTSDIIIDVNTADTSVLKKVPGIGSVISRNVVNYRNRLGGFYDVSQLLEIKYVDTTLLKWFDVKSEVYRKIKVNSDNIETLRKHPYMDFYKAKAIVEYRRKRGRIDGLSRISMFKEFSESDIERLRHYLSFE